jgi:fumarate reductase iron-sulfur subunit
MPEDKIIVEIQRYNPKTDDKPTLQKYEVPHVEGSSVMNILDYIRENLDSTIAYQSHTACHRGLCGRCTMMINGKPSLACVTDVEGDLKIEPLPRTKIIRDLVFTTKQ